MTSRFEIKKPEKWEVKPITQNTRPSMNGIIFNAAMNTAKKISSERELRRLQWNI